MFWHRENHVQTVDAQPFANKKKTFKLMTYLANYNIQNQYKAKVLETERLTPEDLEEVREIKLEIQEPQFDFSINQSFGVLVENDDGFGHRQHHRLYSVADLPAKSKDRTQLTFLVKRCNYVDEFSGELCMGICSNYLCNRKPGDEITITGPFDLPFQIPEDKTANLILIGMGTGIAPFRAFVKHIYENDLDWAGSIQLYYGANSGLELHYLNEQNDDLTNYYDRSTFEAFHALSPRPHWGDPIALEATMVDRAEMLIEALSKTNTYIFVAGHKKIKENLDKAFAEILGSKESWETRKAELVAGKKWAEVIY